jgi:hypothetical protein
MAPLVNQYYYHGFFEKFDRTHRKGIRALPIEETIDDPRQILPFEQVTKVLDSMEYFCVSTCACKHRKNIDPESPDCRYPSEVCLHFDRLGRYIVENGEKSVVRKLREFYVSVLMLGWCMEWTIGRSALLLYATAIHAAAYGSKHFTN